MFSSGVQMDPSRVGDGVATVGEALEVAMALLMLYAKDMLS
jgi:hypothetical protein